MNPSMTCVRTFGLIMAFGRSFSALIVVAPAAAFGVLTGVDFVETVVSSGFVACVFEASESCFFSLISGDFRPAEAFVGVTSPDSIDGDVSIGTIAPLTASADATVVLSLLARVFEFSSFAASLVSPVVVADEPL